MRYMYDDNGTCSRIQKVSKLRSSYASAGSIEEQKYIATVSACCQIWLLHK